MARGRGSASLSNGEAMELLAEMGEQASGAAPARQGAVRVEELCGLWGGMGSILRIDGVLVLKRVRFPPGASAGDERKIRSYVCEAAFYERHAPRLLAPPCSLALPRPYSVRHDTGSSPGINISMSALDGTPPRGNLSATEAEAAIGWLARLHAAYWGVRADELDGLQPQGTYWYLDTRPDELAAMPTSGWEGRLRLAARALDARLKADVMQTVVHGDAKGANMLFTGGKGSPLVAQCYDFQYTGRAPASKDLAYFFCCAVGATEGEREETLLLHYHAELSAALRARGVKPPRLAALRESLWVAYADLARFLSGWGWWGAPGLAKRASALVDALDGGRALASEREYEEAIFRLLPPDYGGRVDDE